MIKRLLGLVLVLGVVGCGSQDSAVDAPETENNPSTSRVTADKSQGSATDDYLDTPVTENNLNNLRGLAADLSQGGTTGDFVVTLENLGGQVTRNEQDEVVYVDLSSARITDSGLARLARLTRLHSLCLDETPITDAGLVHLGRLTGLERLSLNETEVTNAGATELRTALPYCVIYHSNVHEPEMSLPTTSKVSNYQSAVAKDRQRKNQEYYERRDRRFELQQEVRDEQLSGIYRGPKWLEFRQFQERNQPVVDVDTLNAKSRKEADEQRQKLADKFARKYGFDNWESWKEQGGPTEGLLQKLSDQPTVEQATDDVERKRRIMGPKSVEVAGAQKRFIEAVKRKEFLYFVQREMETQ